MGRLIDCNDVYNAIQITADNFGVAKRVVEDNMIAMLSKIETVEAIPIDQHKTDLKIILNRLKVRMKDRDEDNGGEPLNAVDRGYHLAYEHLCEEIDNLLKEKEEVNCNVPAEEITRSFIEDVEAVKDQLPTTKDNLVVDCISRAQAQTEIEMNASRYTIAKERGGMGQVEWSDQLIKVSDAVDIIRQMPSVTPQEPMVIPIAEVKLDKDKLKELVDRAVLTVIPQEPRWIPVSEKLPKAGEYVRNVEKYYLVQNEYGDMLVARYTHSGYWEQIYQLKPYTDEIVAWMPLPKAYSEVEK